MSFYLACGNHLNIIRFSHRDFILILPPCTIARIAVRFGDHCKVLPTDAGGDWEHLANLRPSDNLVAWLNGFDSRGVWSAGESKRALDDLKKSKKSKKTKRKPGTCTPRPQAKPQPKPQSKTKAAKSQAKADSPKSASRRVSKSRDLTLDTGDRTPTPRHDNFTDNPQRERVHALLRSLDPKSATLSQVQLVSDRQLSPADNDDLRGLWDVDLHSQNVSLSLPFGIDGSSVNILERHMSRLNPANANIPNGTWLHDEVINAMMVLFNMRDADRRAGAQDQGQRVFLSSFFFSVMYQDNGTFQFERLRRQLERNLERFGVPGALSVFDCDVVAAPLNISNSHWVLIAAFMERKCIVVFDSMGAQVGTEQVPYRDGLFKFISQLALLPANGPAPSFNADEWEVLNEIPHFTPKQDNCNDCGVFTCMCAHYIGMGLPLLHDTSTNNLDRARIALSLKRQRVEL